MTDHGNDGPRHRADVPLDYDKGGTLPEAGKLYAIPSPPSGPLDHHQDARVAALKAARGVLSATTIVSNASPDLTDLITVATWIIDGLDPWPALAPVVVDERFDEPEDEDDEPEGTGDVDERFVTRVAGRAMHVTYDTKTVTVLASDLARLRRVAIEANRSIEDTSLHNLNTLREALAAAAHLLVVG